jgi:hypothetical protein
MEWFKTINSQDIRAIRSRKMTVTQINAGKTTQCRLNVIWSLISALMIAIPTLKF